MRHPGICYVLGEEPLEISIPWELLGPTRILQQKLLEWDLGVHVFNNPKVLMKSAVSALLGQSLAHYPDSSLFPFMLMADN